MVQSNHLCFLAYLLLVSRLHCTYGRSPSKQSLVLSFGIQMQVVIDLMLSKAFINLRSHFIQLAIVNVFMVHAGGVTEVGNIVFEVMH